MPWFDFYATPEDIQNIIEFIYNETDCRVFETYSEYDCELREFPNRIELEQAFELGIDRDGKGLAILLSLWSPSVMPDPEIKRIDLKVKDHEYRYGIEGCGLYWLHLGGIFKNSITTSKFGFFTEEEGLAKCCVQPGPDQVNWEAHEVLAYKLRNFILHRHEVRTDENGAVHQGAAELLDQGYRLLVLRTGS